MSEKGKTKYHKEIDLGKYYKYFAYLVAVILINLVGISLFFRIDLTRDRLYSISDVSKKVVSTLSEPLTIHVFFSKNLPAPHNNTERYLQDLLKEYAIFGNRYFNYQFHDVSVSEGTAGEATGARTQEMAENYGIYPVQVQNIEKDEVKFQRAFMGMAFVHGDMIDRIGTITGTEGLEYKITTVIQKMNNKISALLRLQENINIKLYLSSSLLVVAPYIQIQGLAEVPQKLENIVKDINDKHYGKISFSYIDPTTEPGRLDEAKGYNIMQLSWPALKDAFGKDIAAGEGIAGLVIEGNSKVSEHQIIQVYNVPLLGTQYQLLDMTKAEELVNESIENLIDINEDIGYLADYGTWPLYGYVPGQQQQNPMALSNFNTLLSQGYSVKPLNLKDEEISSSYNTLILAGMKEELSDYDLFKIDQFLMKGKSLAIFMDSFNEVQPPQGGGQMYNQGPMYMPLNTGLQKLLDHYGMSVKTSYVLDENCYKQRVNQQFGGGEQPIYFAPLIKNENISESYDFMRSIKGLVMVKISPLQINQQKMDDFKLNPMELFSSSDQAWEMSGRINLNPYMMQKPADSSQLNQFPLAYIIEGEFPSYFAGKPIPEKPAAEEEKPEENPGEAAEETGGSEKQQEEADKKESAIELDTSKITGKGEVLSKGRPGRIFLIGSSEILKNSVLDAEGKSPNAIFLLNALDYLNGREDIAVMRSKQQTFNPLKDSSSSAKTFVKTFNIVVVPLMVIMLGLVIWMRRNNRRRQLQLKFQPKKR